MLVDALLELIERVNERNGAENHAENRFHSPTGSPSETLEGAIPSEPKPPDQLCHDRLPAVARVTRHRAR